MLVKHGLDVVDQNGAQAYLEASKKGLGLYLRYGWKTVEVMSVDTRPYGGTGIETTEFMVRDPRPAN